MVTRPPLMRCTPHYAPFMSKNIFQEHAIRIATSTVADGNMGFRFGEHKDVVENRAQFLAKHGVSYENHICMACTQGSIITNVNISNYAAYLGAKTPEAMLESEVLVTQEKDLALMLLTADCIPGVFYDPVREVIALAHLNRHTIAHDLAQKTVSFLREHYGSKAADLRIHFGPHIQVNSYCFSLPLTSDPPPQLADFVLKQGDTVKIDLQGAFKHQLIKAGVVRDHITVSTSDTATSQQHFSHYRAKHDTAYPEGRMATIAMLTSSSRVDSGA